MTILSYCLSSSSKILTLSFFQNLSELAHVCELVSHSSYVFKKWSEILIPLFVFELISLSKSKIIPHESKICTPYLDSEKVFYKMSM